MSIQESSLAIPTMQNLPAARPSEGRSYWFPAAALILAVNFCFLVFYVFVGYKKLFNADSAMKILLAREIIDSHHFFPPDWYYGNNDIVVVFGQLFAIPAMIFLPAGFTVHAISGLVTSILVLHSVWLATGLAPIGKTQRTLITASMAAGISGLLAENLYGQASYGTILYMSLYLIYCLVRLTRAQSTKHVVLWSVLLCVLITTEFWGNPQRALITIGMPFVTAALWSIYRPGDHRGGAGRASLLGMAASICAGIGGGTILYAVTFAHVNNAARDASSIKWLPYDAIVGNLAILGKEMLVIFGGQPPGDSELLSVIGLYGAVRMVVAILLVWLIVRAVATSARPDGEVRPLAIYGSVALLSVCFLQVATTIPNLAEPIASSRYLVPSLITMAIAALATPLDMRLRPIEFISVAVVLAGLLTSAYPTFVRSDPQSHMNLGLQQPRAIDFSGLARYLEDNGLAYGYATYWNAGPLSVLSDERVLVRQITLDGPLPTPMRFLSSDRWYLADAWKGETFLVLTQEEANKVDWKQLAALGLPVSRKLQFGNLGIFVFGENIAAKLPGWDIRFKQPVTFHANAGAPTQVGSLQERGDAKALVARTTAKGALFYGPYVSVARGTYRLTFDVEANGNPAAVARLDAASSPGGTILAQKDLTESHGPQQLLFSIEHTSTMEFRVWALGNGEVAFKSVTIQRAEP
ncbi:hypothetical protein RFM68_06655 [Mesorhizobium sp. MSK_1335]|uniref:Glycosyltransferase RgtA/B/C/D-like domain-containing protein n=1 Tax=Mesorhizobium montanum TaxID=3072323 RepID=A0ABU4ZFP5_9HYPH|nr:hypothetical protein [Mesorhizobium sp. MSK_1335]MDX8524179.1 hypothetical protein [Mesorhizobium sp. MSK_1335]